VIKNYVETGKNYFLKIHVSYFNLKYVFREIRENEIISHAFFWKPDTM
jgi:hypothetical protein